MLSAKAYNAAGKNVDFVRQSDIDKVCYLEFIMKPARQSGGRVANRDVMGLLHLERKPAYRQLKNLWMPESWSLGVARLTAITP